MPEGELVIPVKVGEKQEGVMTSPRKIEARDRLL